MTLLKTFHSVLINYLFTKNVSHWILRRICSVGRSSLHPVNPIDASYSVLEKIQQCGRFVNSSRRGREERLRSSLIVIYSSLAHQVEL